MAMGYKTGLFSTVRNYINNRSIEATHTTPDPIQLNKLLAEMVEIGCDYCFMEVSSHAIAQNRISGLSFSGGVFSNLTHDHLDYHKTFSEYLNAKKMFFDNLKPDAFALTNIDDKNGAVMLQNCNAIKKTYSLHNMADFRIKIIESDFTGLLLNFNGIDLSTRFVGVFNAYNILAVISTALLLNQKQEDILKSISTLTAVDGRFETINSANGITAIVDYAHTPDAIENVLKTINSVRNGAGSVITVIGAGGNRDKAKRPIMAKIACELSTKLILTSDNPRNEKPEDIIADMLSGLDILDKKKTICITDRAEAIKTSVMLANPGDVILIAGKGHENYQEVNGVKHHFDDKETIKEFLLK
jgi:UDP-N-acetylmuramoyl-L-alanyl-D-glutamate--2,6-diaminopimelate ligase